MIYLDAYRMWLFGLVVLLGMWMPASAAAQPVVVSATFLGTGGDDLIEDVAISADGTIYIVGHTAELMSSQVLGIDPVVHGEVVPPRAHGYRDRRGREHVPAQYECAFVAKLSSDGRRVLAWTQWRQGNARFTSIALSEHGIYIGGYSNEGLEPVVRAHGGLITERTTWQHEVQPFIYRDHFTDDRYDHRIDVRGMPTVLRMAHDLSRIDAATYLEGWQSVWHVPRPLGEDRWQPVALAVLGDGDIAVCHDGGAQAQPNAVARNRYEQFFHVPDYVSRLSPDLKQRRWKLAVYAPRIDPAKVNRHYPTFDWRQPHLGQTRVMRMRADRADHLYLAGWSPTQTSSEPWWSPFLWKVNGQGEVVWKVYDQDPMSGAGDRMANRVSDASIRSVAVDDAGQVLIAGKGDGGNSVLRVDPRDYHRSLPGDVLRGQVHSFRGRTLFWGTVARLSAEDGGMLHGQHVAGMGSDPRRGGAMLQPAWATDIAPAADARVLAIGRHTAGFHFTSDAWHRSDWGSFVRVYDADFQLRFSTSLPEADLMTIARHGQRYVAVGRARSGDAPTHEALSDKHAGGMDGYIVVIDLP